MAVLVSTIYTDVCNALLENQPPGLTIATTQQGFLDLFRAVYLEFAEKAGIVRQIFTQQVNAGTNDYLVPDDIIKPTHAFLAGKVLQETSLQELDQYEFAWPKRLGAPDRWRQDALPPKTVEIFPNPIQSGTAYAAPNPPANIAGVYGDFRPADRNLSLVGTAGTYKTSFALADTIPNLPDTFTFYLTYGVLQKIWEQDGEAHDPLRAAYCQARFQEGWMLCKAFMGQEQAPF